MSILTALESELVPIDSVQPHPQNPRRGNVSAIRESIRLHGFVGVIVCQQSRRRIVIGRHRWQAAKEEGMVQLPVMWVDIDDEQALRLLLADNRASDLAGYEDDALLKTLRDLGNFQGTLFDLDAVESLEAKVGLPLVEMPEFRGEYADSGVEMEAREKAAERIAQELKDVVLVMKPDDYAEFMQNIKKLGKRFGTIGVIATTLMAARTLALDEAPNRALEDRVERMRKWREKLEWAVPNHDRLNFLEDFG